jgi:Carboxypeptidase regulatory-like domain
MAITLSLLRAGSTEAHHAMRKIIVIAALLLTAASALAWQFGGNSGNGTMGPPPPRREPVSRSLSGAVVNQHDSPLPQAVVYLKNTRTRTIKTTIAGDDGSFEFNSLSRTQDYEVYAEIASGDRSPTKTLSSFDSRIKAVINLHIDVKKKKG